MNKMDKISMCRICLVEDIRMCPIVDTQLQTVYESLTSKPVEINDWRPLQACYICYARLRACHQLRKTCERSEHIFTTMLAHGQAGDGDVKRLASQTQVSEVRPALMVTAVVHLSVGTAGSPADVKPEPREVPDLQEHNDDTHRVVKNEVEIETEVTSLVTVKTEPRRDIDEGDTSEVNPPASTCEAQATTEQKLSIKQQHMKLAEKLTRDKPFYYQCRMCKRSFYEMQHLQRHECSAGDKRPHQCQVCQKRYKSRSRLVRHAKIHSQKEPYKCQICNKTFAQQHLLRYHSRSHSGEKPHQCQICQKRFITRSYLTKHSATHTEHRPHECQICHNQFKSKSNLTVHIRSKHSKEKPYQCEICNKCFSFNGNLKKHLQIHNGQRPHACDQCDKCFVTNSDLVKHLRTHTVTGQKPYQCEVCHETFNYNSNYLKHRRVRCTS